MTIYVEVWREEKAKEGMKKEVKMILHNRKSN